MDWRSGYRADSQVNSSNLCNEAVEGLPHVIWHSNAILIQNCNAPTMDKRKKIIVAYLRIVITFALIAMALNQ